MARRPRSAMGSRAPRSLNCMVKTLWHMVSSKFTILILCVERAQHPVVKGSNIKLNIIIFQLINDYFIWKYSNRKLRPSLHYKVPVFFEELKRLIVGPKTRWTLALDRGWWWLVVLLPGLIVIVSRPSVIPVSFLFRGSCPLRVLADYKKYHIYGICLRFKVWGVMSWNIQRVYQKKILK